MISNDEAIILHDRYTRENVLTEEERASLEEWYDTQDEAESKEMQLKQGDEVSTMRAQVEKALGDLAIVTSRIQTIASENDSLRKENAKLRRQLALY